jgi:aspartyl-tRNA(Asn)/glutamyl-tRNA(Gln) amidotransferase subunit A
VGYKPSLARVPHAPLKNGLDALSHLGPMTRNVPDAALLMSVIAGPHDADWASLPAEPADYVDAARASVAGARVAWIPELDGTPVDAEVASVCESAMDAFRAAGCEVETLEPVLDDWTAPWRTIFDVMEAAGVADRMEEVRALSEPSFVEVVESGLGFSGVDFMLAAAARRDVWAQLAPLYQRFAVLVTPTLTAPPLPVDPETGRPDDPNAWREAWFRHVYQFNMTGQPAMTVPAGLTADGLPVGIQVIGPRYADATVVQLAAAYEAHSAARDLRPPRSVGQ